MNVTKVRTHCPAYVILALALFCACVTPPLRTGSGGRVTQSSSRRKVSSRQLPPGPSKQARQAFLSKNEDLPIKVRQGVYMGMPALGMSRDAAVAAFGSPDREHDSHYVLGVKCTMMRYAPRESFLWKKDLRVYLQGGEVIGWNWGPFKEPPDRWEPSAAGAAVSAQSEQKPTLNTASSGQNASKSQPDGTPLAHVTNEARRSDELDSAFSAALRVVQSTPAEGVSLVQAVAMQGSGPAAVWLYHCYAQGVHVDKDLREAFRWAHKAGSIEPPYGPGCYELYTCYSQGIGTRIDEERALAALLRGKSAGNLECSIALAESVAEVAGQQEDPDAQFEMMRLAVRLFEEAMDTPTALEVQRALDRGESPKDLDGYRSRAAVAGAILRLTSLYNSHQVDRPEESVRLVRWAVAVGLDSSGSMLFELAQAYRQGKGISQDPRAAFNSYLKAADAGYPPAFRFVGRCYDSGEGVLENDHEANRWFKLAAACCGWDGLGACELGRQYLEGEGVEPDNVTAYAWFSIGAQSGYSGAREKAALQQTLSSDELREGQQLATELLAELREVRSQYQEHGRDW